jgi:glycosyltransferase involved in cell wall biosynthesis
MQAMIGDVPPAVSVLMTTWNGAGGNGAGGNAAAGNGGGRRRSDRSGGFIGAAIASVLAQSFTDFELIVVDDGSTDATPSVLAGIGDPRLRVLRQAANGGVVAARNAGLAAARGRYVAALDHDDLSHPHRLARQVTYLDAHPGVVLVATEIEIEAAGRRTAPDHPTGGEPALIRWLLHVDNPLTWSSVMFRADAVRRLGRSCARHSNWRTISIFSTACWRSATLPGWTRCSPSIAGTRTTRPMAARTR